MFNTGQIQSSGFMVGGTGPGCWMAGQTTSALTRGGFILVVFLMILPEDWEELIFQKGLGTAS